VGKNVADLVIGCLDRSRKIFGSVEGFSIDFDDVFLALDDLPSGSDQRIPLWLFGFLR
jgi:hypothetical protein